MKNRVGSYKIISKSEYKRLKTFEKIYLEAVSMTGTYGAVAVFKYFSQSLITYLFGEQGKND